ALALLERGRARAVRDRGDCRRIEDLVGQHTAVSQGAVRGSERTRRREGRELIGPNRKIGLDRLQESGPAVPHARSQAERLRPVRNEAEARLSLLVHLANRALRLGRRDRPNERHVVLLAGQSATAGMPPPSWRDTR